MNTPAQAFPAWKAVRAFLALAAWAALSGSLFAQGDPRPSASLTLAQALETASHTPLSGPVKCGTSLLVELSAHRAEGPDAALDAVSTALQRPLFQKSRVSAQGHFRVHYDTAGTRQPALLAGNSSRIPGSHEAFVDSVLTILETVRDQETGVLGYEAPPGDGTKGGGPEYDVYVESLGAGLFGATYWETDDLVSTSPNERYATYMEIDNDFLGYRTPGMSGLRVTVAHEYFHAIQVGSVGIWPTATKSDFYFYELSSTWMEEVLWDDVNDYVYEVRDYLSVSGGRGFRDFQGQALPFTTYGLPSGYYGYERALFAVFLEAKFGRSLLRDIWFAMRAEPFLQAIESVLGGRGTDFEHEYAWFGFWNYYTADRTDSVRYYSEGRLYPRFDPHMRMSYNGYYASISSSGAPLSDQHFEFVGQGDTIHAVIMNVNALGASTASPLPASLSLTASNQQQGGMRQKLANGTEMSLMVETPSEWRTLYLLTSTDADARIQSRPSPNPLSLGETPALTIPLDGSAGATASVWLLSASLDLVFNRDFTVTEQFGQKIVLVSSSELRSSVSTGVHFLVVRSGGSESTWKIAIVK